MILSRLLIGHREEHVVQKYANTFCIVKLKRSVCMMLPLPLINKHAMQEYYVELYLFSTEVGDTEGLQFWCEAFQSWRQKTWWWCLLLMSPLFCALSLLVSSASNSSLLHNIV